MNEPNNSDDSDDEEKIEIPEQVIDPENPWLAERKEFSDFMTGYTNFIKNNCNAGDYNDQNESSKLKENNETIKFDELKNHHPKVKTVKIDDLSILSDEESDIDVIEIMNPEKNDIIESEIKIYKIDKNIKINSNTPKNKKNNIEIIHTIAGTWYVSSDDIRVNSIKKKKHKDVENVFKNVETVLKNKINEKLINLNNLNKVEIKQPSNKDVVKHNNQNLDTDYLKINNKRRKAEFNEPLYENDKILDTINKNNVINNPGLNTKITEKSIKQVQDIDPTEFLQVTQTYLETEEMPQIEDHLDDKEKNEQEKLIAEAFADDDIIKEFKYKL